jgi:hypothetical protein
MEELMEDQLKPPPGAEIIVYDAKYRFGKEREGKPYMWTWIGADRWYMADVYPVPKQYTRLGDK